jgi:hypothetical protein
MFERFCMLTMPSESVIWESTIVEGVENLGSALAVPPGVATD